MQEAILPAVELSAVVPVLDEVESLPQMRDELVAGLTATGRTFEVVFVDDGSRDGSDALLDRFAAEDPRIRVVHLRKNFGKSPALAAAFERVRGAIVITLDADLQDDPAMIPELVAKIDEGYDLVSGYKRERHDPVGKRLPSKVFNAVVRLVSGVPLSDFNCGFKAYRIECIRELSVYGGFHRFLPVLASERGFRIAELVVRHRPRRHGHSKFGSWRLAEGLLDLLTVLMVTRFRTRPLHLFGFLAALTGITGVSVLAYLSVLWFMGEPIGTRPLLTLGVLLTLAAIQFIGTGLVAELLVRTTVSSREIASIREPRGPARVGIREAAEPQLPGVPGVREGIAALPVGDGNRHEPAVALADREGATVRRGGGV